MKAAKPFTVIFPPPDSAVRFRIVALVPFKVIVPLAFEMPFGESAILIEAFFSTICPLERGSATVPRKVI